MRVEMIEKYAADGWPPYSLCPLASATVFCKGGWGVLWAGGPPLEGCF